MRHLVTLVLLMVTYHAYPQACKMPGNLDEMRPEKCGIRYVKSDGDKINVILEFEKKTRIITPDNPNDVRGKLVNLIGLYYLTYDANGEILEEDKKFVQTGEVPERGLVFGLNGQKGLLLDADLKLISLDDYAQVPWGGSMNKRQTAEIGNESSEFRFETALNVDKNLKLTDLQIVKWRYAPDGTDTTAILRKKASLIEYDSASKKQYWVNQYLPVTDPRDGYTLALLNRVDKEIDKEISEKQLRLVAFDTNGQVAGLHDFEFPNAMQIVYRDEIFAFQPDSGRTLDKEILVMQATDNTSDAYKLGQYYFYRFDKMAQLQSSSMIVSKHEVFDPVNVLWQGDDVLYMSSTESEVVSCFIQSDGKYNISSTGHRLNSLKTFLSSGNHNSKALNFRLIGEPTIFDDGEILMIYRVEENVGVMAGVEMSEEMAAATRVNHGLVPVLMMKDGQIVAADFYQRPNDADPRALITIGQIEKNSDGIISFYATDQTSEGTYPILCTIQANKVSFVRSDEGAIASRLIYYDPNEGVVSYFSRKQDPNDPRISIRTLEVLRVDD